MLVDKVLLVPGICGSVLKDGDETIWPGTPWNKIFNSYPDRYVDKLANSDTIRATGILRSVPLIVAGVTLHHFDGYSQAFEALEEIGFSEADGTLIPFPYDWRQDIRTTAQVLHDTLATLLRAGKLVASERLGIVAHSMGGLVVRYLLEKIGLPPGVMVTVTALVAVPHLGAPASLQNIVGLRPEIFLTAAQCKIAVGNSRFPSAYQLLPRATIPALLEISPDFGYREPNLLSEEVRNALDLSAASLAKASALWSDLAMIGPGWQSPNRYFAIVGNEQKTIAANYLGVEGILAQALEEPSAGDGTVPLWSAAPPLIPVRYVPSEHGSMFTDPRARQILRAILRPDPSAPHPFLADAIGPLATISVQPTQPSVQTGDVLTVALVADISTTDLQGDLVIETHHSEDKVDRRTVPITYKGGPLRSLSLDLPVPDDPALLRLSFIPTAGLPQGREGVVLVLPGN